MLFAEQCLSTEYFDDNYLREFVIKYSFDPDNLPVETELDIYGPWLDYVYDVRNISEISIPEDDYNGQEFDHYINESGWGQNFLLTYADTTYPSQMHPYYVEATPMVNPDTQTTINLFVEEYETLVAQPFTYLRGGKVAGNDTLRHALNLINNGGDFCMNFTELIFNGPSKFIYHSGHVDLSGKTACMMFTYGGTLEVAPNTTFYYGENGEGAIAFGKGGTIKLNKNSTLHINNDLVLLEDAPWPDRQV